MQRSERILVVVFGVTLFLVVGYFGVVRGLVGAVKRLDSEHAGHVREKRKLENKLDKEKVYLARLREFGAQTFGTDVLEVGDEVRTHLTALIRRSGLSEESLTPITGDTEKAYYEIGRNIQARGKLEHAINFLYLVQVQPYAHRIDNFSVKPVKGQGLVDVAVRYTTPIVKDAYRFNALPTTRPTSQPAGNLDSPARQQYQLIATRDFFRPYVKRPPAPPRPALTRYTPRPDPPARRDPPRQDPLPPVRPSPESNLKVVNLSDWNDVSDVSVYDARSRTMRTYRVGEELAGGVIAMVDYRALPRIDKPHLSSPSRVILQLGPEYWAVELGQPLASKRRLKPDELPEQLRPGPTTSSQPTTAPTDDPTTVAATGGEE